MMCDPTNVLFIAGFGRSGSTLLGQVLAGTPGFVHVGELNFIWEHNVLQNRHCGCGVAFRDCPFWEEVMGLAFGGFDVVDPHDMVRQQQRGTRTRHAVQMLIPTGRRRIERRLDSFVQNTAAIYRAVRAVSGADVIVDSSKLPPYGFLQAQSPGIDLRCVHLIRDPRATAYSWLRRSRVEGVIGEDYLPPIGTTESSMTWTAWNLVTELLWRSDSSHYTRIRYEDFVRDPRRWSGAMTALCGFANAALPIDHDKLLSVGVAHTVAGNPNRFDTGAIAIRADQAWEDLIGSRQRYAVTAMTLPFLRHYGYPIGRSSRR